MRFTVLTTAALMIASSVMAQPPGGLGGQGGQGRGGAQGRGGFGGGQGRGGFGGQGGAAEAPGGPGGMLRMLPLMIALDTDKDGEISEQEINNATKALKTLDKDGNGKLTVDELRPNFAGGRGGPGAGRPGGAPGVQPPAGDRSAMMTRMFESSDADKDGKLSGDEIPERMKQNLQRIDSNGDGAVDKKELKKMIDAMGAGGRRGAGGRGQGPGAETEDR